MLVGLEMIASFIALLANLFSLTKLWHGNHVKNERSIVIANTLGLVLCARYAPYIRFDRENFYGLEHIFLVACILCFASHSYKMWKAHPLNVPSAANGSKNT